MVLRGSDFTLIKRETLITDQRPESGKRKKRGVGSKERKRRHRTSPAHVSGCPSHGEGRSVSLRPPPAVGKGHSVSLRSPHARGELCASAARSALLLLHVCTEPNTSGDGDKGCAATKQRVPGFSEADERIHVKKHETGSDRKRAPLEST